MCTVSWTAVRNGYDLFFNRDELHTRAPETPPALSYLDGVSHLAPRDGQHDGTWLAVNEFGLTVCLLNDYGAPWRPPANPRRFSRGHVVKDCAAAATHADVLAAICREPLSRTMPFQLVALSPEEGVMVVQWRGAGLRRWPGAMTTPPITSSSFATDEVIAARTHRFATFVPSARDASVAELSAYHRQHDPQAGAHSVLMSRHDAATRSICHVTVDRGGVRLCYAPISRSHNGPAVLPPVTLELVRRTGVAVAI